MANKFLSLNGLKYFVDKIIGKTDIAKVADGTLTGGLNYLVENTAKIVKGKKTNSLTVDVTRKEDEALHGLLIVDGLYVFLWYIDEHSQALEVMFKQTGLTPNFDITYYNPNVYVDDKKVGTITFDETGSNTYKEITCIML